MRSLPSRAARVLHAARTDVRGVSAVEFAFVLPVMLAVLLGGFQVSQGVSAYRKVTTTARAVADLTTQYATMSASDMSRVLNASAQIMAPFPTTNLTIVLTEFTAPATSGQATVIWSKALNGTALTWGSKVTLPTNICQPSASIVRADVTYVYTPPVGYAVTGSFTMRDTLYMSPRRVQTVAYTGT